MTKNTKILLGVGALAVAGYLVYKQMNKTKGFATSKFAPPKPLCTQGQCINGSCWQNNQWQSCKTDSTNTKGFTCPCGRENCSCGRNCSCGK